MALQKHSDEKSLLTDALTLILTFLSTYDEDF